MMQRREEQMRDSVRAADFARKVRAVFDKYAFAGTEEIDAWDVNKALSEIGRPKLADEKIFDLIRTADDVEVSKVSFRRFMQMCESGSSGKAPLNSLRVREMNMKTKDQEDLVRAWEAVGGNQSLGGHVKLSEIKSILNSFELKTDLISSPRPPSSSGNLRGSAFDKSDEDIDFAEFCALLERPQDGETEVQDAPLFLALDKGKGTGQRGSISMSTVATTIGEFVRYRTLLQSQ